MLSAIFLLPLLVSSGLLKPKTPRPVLISPTNQSLRSSYTFHFQVERSTFPDSVLKVSFPRSSFPRALSGVQCTALLGEMQPLVCWMQDWEAHISIGELSNSPVDNTYVVTIVGVPNPPKDGVTGYFRLATWTGINLLDHNDFFGQVGITPTYIPISTASVVCLRTCKSGQFDDYLVTFQLPVSIQSAARVYIVLSDRLYWDISRGCRSVQVPGLLCVQEDQRTIRVSNFQDYFLAGSTVQIQLPNVLNQSRSGPSLTFLLSIYLPTTHTLLTQSASIPGPLILPSDITIVSVCPNASANCDPLEATVVADNKLKFTLVAQTSTEIPLGGALQVSFSPDIQTIWANSCLVLSGLHSQNGVSCVVSPAQRKATISNLSSFPPGQFSLSLLLTTPLLASTIGSFTIATYPDSALAAKIDSTQSSISIPLLNIPSPGWTPIWSQPDLVAGASVGLTSLRFNPNSPIGSGKWEVKLRFASEFRLPSTAVVQTSTWDQASSVLISLGNSQSDPTTNLLTLALQPDPTTIPIGANVIAVAGLLQLPITPGSYPVSVRLVKDSVTVQALEWWVDILPTAFGSASFSANSYNAGQKTIFEVVLVPSVAVPASAGNAVYGSITVTFPLVQGWAHDLGTGLTAPGSVACLGFSTDPVLQNALLPLTGGTVTCQLAPSLAGADPVLTVANFQAVSPGTRLQLNLVNLSNVSQAGRTPSIQLATYSNLQLSATVLNTATVLLPFTTVDSSLVPAIMNGRNRAPYGDGQNQVQFMPNTRGSGTVMRFLLWPENDIPSFSLKPGSYLFLQFPVTYPLPDTGVSCIIGYTVPINCYTVPFAGWLVVYNVVTSYLAHTEYPFDVKGLTNPMHKIPADSLNITVIASFQESEYLAFASFPAVDLGTISPAAVTADNYESARVDVTYFFLFTPSSLLYANSTIVLSFPKNLYVTTTFPALECSLSGLSPAYGLEPSCTYRANAVTISGFGAREAGLPIMVKIKHVLNPVQVGLTDYFSIETFSWMGWLMDANYYVVGVQIVSRPPPPKLLHLRTWADPSNGYHSTSVTASFLPTVTVPSGAIVDLQFPKGEFPALPAKPDCGIAGAIIFMESCESEGNNLRLQTRGAFVPGPAALPVNITLHGLTGFTPGVTSGPIFIQIQYSGLVVNESPQDESDRKIVSDLEPSSLSTGQFSFAPQTAAEEAVYSLTFSPRKDLNESCVVGVEFGANYGRRLGRVVACFSEALSTSADGKVDCEVEARTVLLHPAKAYLRREFPAVTISLSRVINPDYQSGLIRIGLFTKYYTNILEEGHFTPNTQLLPLPYFSFLTTTTVSTHLTGSLSTLNIAVTEAVGRQVRTEDWVLVDFPLEYELEYVKSGVQCWYAGLVVDCQVNENRVAVRLLDTGKEGKEYIVQITGVETPWDPQESPYICLSLYHSASLSILSKTTSNLNPISALSFTTLGQEILINGNLQFTHQVGTRSLPLFIYLETPCAAAFSMTPIGLKAGFHIVPERVEFRLGDVSGAFQVSVESGVAVGKYVVSWGMQGEWTRPIYAPIRRFKVRLVRTALERISVETVDILPQGGVSYPNIVQLSHGPATQLLLTPIKLGSQPSKITFHPSVLTFKSGETRKTFVIEVDSESKGDSGEFFLYQSGLDVAAYQLDRAIYRFNVGFGVSAECNITHIRAVNVTKTTAEVKFSTNMEIAITWMVALDGVRAPTLEELTAQKYTGVAEGELVFGVAEGERGPGQGWDFRVRLETLRTARWYVVYVASVSETYPTPLHSVRFQTSFQARPAYATFRFLRVLDSPAGFLTALSQLLLLNVSRLSLSPPNATYPSTLVRSKVENDAPLATITGGRALQAGLGLYNVWVVLQPGDALALSPFQYLATVNSDLLGLKETFPDFDTSAKVQPRDIPRKLPALRLVPQLVAVTNTSAELADFFLSCNGTFYLCLTASSNSDLSPPRSMQIYSGTDSTNAPCVRSLQVQATPQGPTVLLLDLDPGSTYWVYVTAGNQVPGEPDLVEDEEVVGVGFVTARRWTMEEGAVGLGLVLFWL